MTIKVDNYTLTMLGDYIVVNVDDEMYDVLFLIRFDKYRQYFLDLMDEDGNIRDIDDIDELGTYV